MKDARLVIAHAHFMEAAYMRGYGAGPARADRMEALSWLYLLEWAARI